MASEPAIAVNEAGEGMRFALSGAWTLAYGRLLEERCAAVIEGISGKGPTEIDIGGIERLDTLGAHLVNQLLFQFKEQGVEARLSGVKPDQKSLLDETQLRGEAVPTKPAEGTFYGFLADIGAAVSESWDDLKTGISFLGAFIVALLAALINFPKFRINALVSQLELVALRGVPIIVLISFLVGAIVAQQGVFQMEKFGAAIYVVDLLGVLILRELAVLLTSIMIAGRSGSAFTAEIGSMKMREEIDALRTMGVDPMSVLIVPRVLALIIGLPLLTFISAMAALFGGGLVVVFYGNVSPEVFLSRLQSAIALNTFLVGLIKAPFMALVIGLIASIEGMKVRGSAESLGRQTTSSVVKSIFMVIVVDGLFAMFFASIRY